MSDELHVVLLKGLVERVDSVASDFSQMRVTMAENTSSLKEHMQRTAMLEKALEKMDGRVKPLEVSSAMWAGVNKGLVVLACVAGLVATLIKLLA